MEQWLKTETNQRCRPKELRRREQIVRLHLAPRLGGIPLAKLAPATIEEFFASLNSRSASHVFNVLRAALNHAVRLDLILANPTERVTAPRPAEFRPTLWTIEETIRFLGAARPSAHYALFATEIATGLRLGELLGLRWRDVDLERGVLTVTAELDRPQGGGFRFADLKSRASRRTVRLPVEVTDALRAAHRHQVEQRLRRGPCARDGTCQAQHCLFWHEHEFVFTQPNGKPLHGHNLTQRTFRTLMVTAGVPRIRFYDLRHCHGTLLASSGVNLKVIKERMGHSAEAFTLSRYVHVIDMQEDAARTVSQRLFSTPSLLSSGQNDARSEVKGNG